MNTLLTIAIPTFNRAELLDEQLEWLSQEIKGFESECEILISDNCSTDDTQKIIGKWQLILSSTTFKSHRNVENIGLMKNIIHCLNLSKTKYVWTVSDDDRFVNGVLTYVISKVKKYEDLSLLFLNFSGRNKITGEAVHPPTIIGNRWFDIETENACSNGKATFEYCFSKSIGSVSLLSATVYRTNLVQESLKLWQDAASNWVSLAYLAGYCAANGSVIVSKDIYLECTVGVNYWQKEPTCALLAQYRHIPEMILKLEESGYSKQFCRGMILDKAREVNLKVLLGALRKWPVLTSNIVIYFLNSIILSAFCLMDLQFQTGISNLRKKFRTSGFSNLKISSLKNSTKVMAIPKLYHPQVSAAIEVFATNYFCHTELDAQMAIDYGEAIDELLLMRNADFFPYSGICVTRLVRDINNLIPPMEFALNNSTNNNVYHKFLVGREGIVSPVLYLKIDKYYITNQDWKKLEDDLTSLATEKYGCDEYGVTENTDSCFQYRFWWDYSKI